MYELKDANFDFLNFYKNERQCFYENVNIYAVYGNPQLCIWDGGRIFTDYKHASLNEVKYIIDKYNKEFNLPVRFVFTNPILKPEHYKDRFCNLITAAGAQYHNEIVIGDDNFMQYLKEKYPSYNFISSTTKCLNMEQTKEELKKEDYKMVCLDYNLNKKLDWLKTFSKDEIEKTEFLVNPICPLKCNFRKDHYFLNGVSHLKYGKNYVMEDCGIKGNTFHPDQRKHHLTYDDIVKYYEPLGFKYFKIEGRTWERKSLILTYIDYMVKPEYKSFAISCLL